MDRNLDPGDAESGPLTDYNEDGVDLTLIRWMLSLTPAERLKFHEEQVNEILEIWEHRGITAIAMAASGR